METPDPPNDTPGTSKQVVLTPHDIPKILREYGFWLDLPGKLVGCQTFRGWTQPGF